ncbi:LapB repeat-containing protein [Listeria innocua]|uniref:LapB repeat-containing protein n=1 Tax=Listeria innocua TaxID=1642 RepID=UPI001886C70F|nr:LapB repeat-containing protein [Listeria innocua]EAF5666476.1 LPXTG cell wall anchor domain-containing protein [Listeria innocua]EKF1862536.1 LapB repeat-containing protein [Listeria innocua]EKF1874558.1 LapB repeat-containing protein [Listeria innocua]EKF1882803.1 LapB repeat-containing protein [Listeria innocua]EKP0388328.1 LapB repeat-containing protein [Listeria innocua]
MKKILHIIIALSVICSIILVPVDWSVKADGNNKRDDLIKSVSFYKSDGQNVTAKENYNEKLNYFLEVAFGGNSFQKGDYFNITLSSDALLSTEKAYDLKVDVDPTAVTNEQVVGKVTVEKINGSPTLHFVFTEDSESFFMKNFDANFKIQVMPAHGDKNVINLSYSGAAKNFKNIGTSSVELNVNMASDWPPVGIKDFTKKSGDLYHAILVYEKPSSKVNYETEILVSYPLFEKRIPLGNVQNIKIEVWDEVKEIYRVGVAGVDYGTITYDVGTPFVGGPIFQMNCTIPFKGISTKTRVSFDIDTNVDGKPGTTDPYLVSLSSVSSATKSLEFYPVNNDDTKMTAAFFGKVTTRFEDELGNPVTFDDYSTVTTPGKVNQDGKFEITEPFLHNSVQNVDKHAYDSLLNTNKYKLLEVTSPNKLSETADNLSIQIKQGYQNDVLYKIKALQKPVISALPEIEYSKTVNRTMEEFLEDVEAKTDIPADIKCDLTNVKWGVPGDYPVLITAVNEDNQAADPVPVTIKISKNPAPVITVDPEITYDKTVTKDESTLLNEVNARTNDGSTITSNINDKVKWGVPGDYEVTLNAVNEDGVAAEAKTFIVRVLKSPAPIITVDPEITYPKTVTKTEAELLQAVNAQTNDGSPLVSDMNDKVKWGVPGDYEVTLNAVNEDGVAAEAKTFIVRILKSPAPIITVDPEVTYDSTIIKNETELLKDVRAETNDNSAITSDASDKVKWQTPGSYTVTLNAVNEDGIPADPVTFIVHIVEAKKAPIVIEENPAETPTKPSKQKPKEKIVIKKTMKLPRTGDTQSKAILGGVLCLGAWFLFRKK